MSLKTLLNNKWEIEGPWEYFAKDHGEWKRGLG